MRYRAPFVEDPPSQLHTGGELQHLEIPYSEIAVVLGSHSVTSLSIGVWHPSGPIRHFPQLTALRTLCIGEGTEHQGKDYFSR